MPDKHRHFSIVVKPVGSACNLRCNYCYYIDKKISSQTKVMSDDMLESYIRQVINIHGSEAEIEFAWHGGEPTIAGISFFQKAMLIQTKYASNRRILNTLQTNGTLLNEEWCRFFADNDFRIGISIDGPQALHDPYRKDSMGKGSFHKVLNAIDLLQKHKVSYNTLTTVNAINAEHGLEVYHFMRSISDYMQFLPVVECADHAGRVALPPGIYSPNVTVPRQMAHFNVTAEAYGHFLCDVYDAWRKLDRGKKFVQIIEASIGNLTHRPAGLCVHESVCGHCAAIEQNGDVYRCDRYVFDEYRMGNIQDFSLDKLMETNRAFGEYKLESLPSKCLHCDVVELCWGGCPKDRIIERLTFQGIERHNYLCKGYQFFFRYLKDKESQA